MEASEFAWHRGRGGTDLHLKRSGQRGRTYASVGCRAGEWAAILDMQKGPSLFRTVYCTCEQEAVQVVNLWLEDLVAGSVDRD